MHGVCTRGKRLSGLTSVRCCSCILAIYYVGSNSKNRGCWNTAAISLGCSHIMHKIFYDLVCDLIHAVIIVSVFRIISLYLKVHNNAVFVTDGFYLCILNGRK